jgi:arsenate reductase
MKKIYYLSTCSTCQRILGQLPIDQFELQDIKAQPMTSDQLEEMKELAGDYQTLFSRRAMKYRSLGLNEQQLSETDYRDWILKEYTFLKRPVAIVDSQIFIGNSKKTIDQLIESL